MVNTLSPVETPAERNKMIQYEEIETLDEMIQYIREKGVTCSPFDSPKGLAHKISLKIKEVQVEALFYCDIDWHVYNLEIVSEQPVDPTSFHDVRVMLYHIKCPRIYRWRMLDTGHYCLLLPSDHDGPMEDLVVTLKKMWKHYTWMVPYIEEVARSKKSFNELFVPSYKDYEKIFR